MWKARIEFETKDLEEIWAVAQEIQEKWSGDVVKIDVEACGDG